LRIGLHALGAEGANPPPAMSLGLRGLGRQVQGYPMWGEEGEASPPARIIDAVAAGEIDVAVVWGPIAGYFAQRYRDKAGDRLVLSVVDADPQLPTLAYAYDLAMGVRRGDEGLRNEVQDVLDRHRPEIQTILAEFGVPQLAPAAPVPIPLPAPAGS
jgi:mxaJ protein